MTGSLSVGATVVEGANDDNLEHPAEDASTNIIITEEDTHISVAPKGRTIPTSTLLPISTGPAASVDLGTPTEHAPPLRRSSHQRRAPNGLGYPFVSRGANDVKLDIAMIIIKH